MKTFITSFLEIADKYADNKAIADAKGWCRALYYARIYEDTLKDVDYDTIINCAAVVKHQVTSGIAIFGI